MRSRQQQISNVDGDKGTDIIVDQDDEHDDHIDNIDNIDLNIDENFQSTN